MSVVLDPPIPSASLRVEGWRVRRVQEATSTNALAARLPAWNAVRAEVQTAGRGRTGRTWVSDAGGLWLSAVLPCPGERSRWSTLPLAAGWAILAALQGLGATGLRLRWPNDILCGRRKLAGLLVERHTDTTAVVGVGINVLNRPEEADVALNGSTTRIADVIPGCENLDLIERATLRALRHAHRILLAEDFSALAERLNAGWTEPRRVEVTLNPADRPFVGEFHGVDAAGRLRLLTADGALRLLTPTDVHLLREID